MGAKYSSRLKHHVQKSKNKQAQDSVIYPVSPNVKKIKYWKLKSHNLANQGKFHEAGGICNTLDYKNRPSDK